jgi:hypothetical protein
MKRIKNKYYVEVNKTENQEKNEQRPRKEKTRKLNKKVKTEGQNVSIDKCLY